MHIGLIDESIFLTLVFNVSQTNSSIIVGGIKTLIKHFQMRKLLKHFLEMIVYEIE